MTSCALLLSILAAAQTSPNSTGLHRKWANESGTQTVEAEFLSIEDGDVRLRKKEGGIVAVALADLSNEDQRYARYKSGLSITDMTGYWKTENDSYYKIVDRGEKLSLQLISSPVLSSLSASLRRSGPKIVADQWRVVFASDKTRTARNLDSELFLGSDGQVRIRSETVTWNATGRTTSRKPYRGPLIDVTEEYSKALEERQLAEQRRRESMIIAGTAILAGLAALSEHNKSNSRADATSSNSGGAVGSSEFRIGDRVCNSGFLRAWNGKIIDQSGPLYEVELAYPPGDVGKRRFFSGSEIKHKTTFTLGELIGK